MALTKASTTITFSDPVVPAATQDASQTSNSWTLDATCVGAQIQVQATAGNAGANDQLEIYLEQSDGTTFDTPVHAKFLGVIDLNAESATTAKFSVASPAGAASVQRIRAQTRAGASLDNAMTVSGVIREQRSS